MTAALPAPDAAPPAPTRAGGAPGAATVSASPSDEPALTALSVEVQSAFEYMPATLAGMAAAAAVVALLF